MIQLKHITVRKQGNTILHDVNLHIPEGEHTAILGPNGSGKSSLLKLFTREYHPVQHESMRLEIFGKPRWNSMELRGMLGIITPDLQRMCRLPRPALEVVASGYTGSIGMYPPQHQISLTMEQQARRALAELDAVHTAGLPMHVLSSGEARRVLIARALIHNPRALILDEPFDSLDVKARKSLRAILSSLARRGRTVIMVTHDLADLLPEISRVILMKSGSVFLQGDTESVVNEASLSQLYDTPVSIRNLQGTYHVWAR